MNLMEILGSMKRGAYRNYLVIVGVEVSAAVKPKSNLQVTPELWVWEHDPVPYLGPNNPVDPKTIMVLYEPCGEEQEQKRHSEWLEHELDVSICLLRSFSFFSSLNFPSVKQRCHPTFLSSVLLEENLLLLEIRGFLQFFVPDFSLLADITFLNCASHILHILESYLEMHYISKQCISSSNNLLWNWILYLFYDSGSTLSNSSHIIHLQILVLFVI